MAISNLLKKHIHVHSLSFHVSAVIFGMMFIVGIAVGYISINHTKVAINNLTVRDLITVTRLLAYEVKESGIPLNNENSDKLVYAMGKIANLEGSNYAAIFNPDQELIAAWQAPGDTSFNPNLNISSRNIFNTKNTIHIVNPLINANGQNQGYFVYGYNKDKLNGSIKESSKTLLVVFPVVLFLACLILRSIFVRLVVGPIRGLTDKLAHIVNSGDLTVKIEDFTNEEFNALAQAFRDLTTFLRDMLGSLKNLSMQLSVIVDDVSLAGQAVNSGAVDTQNHTDKTTSVVQQMLTSISELTNNISDVSKNGEQGASAIYQITKANDLVVHNIHTMNSAIAAARAAVKQSTAGINNIAAHIEKLNNDINFTSSSIEVMADTVDAIENTTKETAALSEEVTNNATMGVEAIQKTTAGIGAIKRSSEMAAQTIGHLGNRINDIGSIIHVIEDITKQTNLLALNAAIIAAQSGENGKSFGVVSEEIAALANRTKSSTREIVELIASIQEESQHAIEAMQEDMGSIEEGVRLGQAAEDILHLIETSANQSTAMVQKIAATTLDQADDIREVNASIVNIAKAVKDINNVTTQQANDSNIILTNINNINNLSQQVLNSFSEQASGTKEVSHSINSISHNLSNLNEAQRIQEKEMEQVMKSIELIRKVATIQTESTVKLENTIASIKAQVTDLNNQVRKFKL